MGRRERRYRWRPGATGSRLGAYLITEETFGDFELLIDVNPDWATDSGIMIRATSLGGQGFQVHMDYRMLGSVATFFGNGIGNWRARHYAFNPSFDAGRRVSACIANSPPTRRYRNWPGTRPPRSSSASGGSATGTRCASGRSASTRASPPG